MQRATQLWLSEEMLATTQLSRLPQPGTGSLQSSDIQEQLEKILAHRLFVRSERMSRFLRFTIGQALQGRSSDLKEYLIGIEVFDRKDSYDPRIDPVVRVEARRLRDKLHAYYEEDGRNDPVLIEFAVGSYAPQIRHRSKTPETIPTSLPNLAVLPFTNLSRSAEFNYFSDGLTEELIHNLTGLNAVRVVAWNSAVLQVTHIMTGSVRISGTSLRVRAQLIDVESGVYLWSETFDRQMQEAVTIQEEIACAIIRTLRVRLTGGAERVMLTRSAAGLSSYDYGRYHWRRRTPDDLNRSARCFEAPV